MTEPKADCAACGVKAGGFCGATPNNCMYIAGRAPARPFPRSEARELLTAFNWFLGFTHAHGGKVPEEILRQIENYTWEAVD